MKTDKKTGWGNLVAHGMDPKESPSHGVTLCRHRASQKIVT